MIYITQLLFVKEGKEETFLEFEDHAIPLLTKHNGQIIYRLRPDKDAFISEHEDFPFEIHFISFESQGDLDNFMNDDDRLNFIHLKNESIRSSLLIKGEKM